VRAFDGDGDGADAQIGGERVGVGDTALAREPRRHEHADDLIGPQGVDCDGGDERRVDAARQPDQDAGEAVLPHVVAGTEDERLVDLLHGWEERLDPRFLVLTESRFAHRDLRQGGRPRSAPRVEQATPERGTHLDVDDQQVFDELTRARHESTALVEHHRRAVEDQLVLPADQVHIEHGHRRVGGARGQHGFALMEAPRVER
jgi:hypothetical protein